MPYLIFDLQLEASEGTYLSRVLNSPMGEASVEFDLPFTQVELAHFFAQHGNPQELGEQLYAAVFAGDVGISLLRSLDEASRQRSTLRIRLRIDPTVPELNSLPWEYLYATPLNRFLALSDGISLLRYCELPHPPKPLRVMPPLQVLVVVSNPVDTQPLDVETEWQHLSTALITLQERGLLHVERLAKSTIAALQGRLRRGDVHVLHFIGHGSFDHTAGQGTLCFEDEQGQSNWVDAARIGTLFYDHDALSLLFLNACGGAQTGEDSIWTGTAQQLIQQGIPAVLAMRFAISDQAAIILAHTFYSATADGYSIDAAVAEARKAVYLDGSEYEWATPIFFSRSPDNRLFEIPQEEDSQVLSTPPKQRATALHYPVWVNRVLIGSSIAFVALLLIGFMWKIFSLPEQVVGQSPTVVSTVAISSAAAQMITPTPLPSRFCADAKACVLVAEFYPPEDELSPEISRKIYAELTSGKLLSLDRFNVQLIDALSDINQVRHLSAQEHANIIVWGQLFQQFQELNINFELTNQLNVNESNQLRPNRVEFFAPLVQQVSCTGECFAAENLRQVLDQLGMVVAHTAAGMLYYGLDQAEEADQEFAVALYCIGESVDRQIVDNVDSNCGKNLQVEGFNAGALYYYAGKSKVLTGDYATALAYLQQAALQNPNDPAPLIGIAVLYQSWLAQDDLPTVNNPLDEAILRTNTLRADMVNRNAPVTEIATADYELGFIAELQHDWQTAERKYQLAINGFGPERSDAYITYIALGRVQHRAGKVKDAEATFQQAYKLDPTVPWALLELAQLYQYDRARSESFLVTAREVAPHQAYVDIITAQLCDVWDESDCAEAAYQSALEKRPNSGWLYSRIGDFYRPGDKALPRQNWAKAGEYYHKAVERRPNDPWTQERYAFALYAQGNYDESAERLAHSLNDLSLPQSQVAARYCTLAQVQQAATLLDDALTNAQTCLAKMDNSDRKAAAEALIAQIQTAKEQLR